MIREACFKPAMLKTERDHNFHPDCLSCHPSAALRTSFDEERGEIPPNLDCDSDLEWDSSLSLGMTKFVITFLTMYLENKRKHNLPGNWVTKPEFGHQFRKLV